MVCVLLLCDTDLFQQKGTFFTAVIHYRQHGIYRPMHFLHQLNTWCFIDEITMKSQCNHRSSPIYTYNNVLDKKLLKRLHILNYCNCIFAACYM